MAAADTGLKGPTEFKVLTVNLGLLRFRMFGMKEVFSNPPYSPERLPAICKALTELAASDKCPDVIALQEVYEAKHFNAVKSALEATHPHVARKQPSGLSPLRFHNALAFLSKYPLKDTHFDLFSANVKLEKVMGTKGALITTMELPTPAGVFDIKMLNIHLTAGGASHPEDPSCDTVREDQITECLEASPDLFLGDFNTGPEASAANYEYALSKGFACGFREAGGKDGDIDGATWDPENPLNAGGVHGDCPPQRVDHVLRRTSGPMADWRVVKTELLFKEPVVEIKHGKCSGKMVTMTDHYGMLFHFKYAPTAMAGDEILTNISNV